MPLELETGDGLLLLEDGGHILLEVPLWGAPGGEDEFYYGRLPFAEAQKVLGATAPVNGTLHQCVASWHGTSLDPERGSFAVVQAGGVLDAFVGERIKVTRHGLLGGPRAAFAYVHNALDIPVAFGIAPDLSLPRRVWLALALPGDDSLAVTVERLA